MIMSHSPSLGMLYQSITQFWLLELVTSIRLWNGAYGKPSYINEIEKLISTTEKGKFELNKNILIIR